MPTYQLRGDVPRKRHIQFRDNGRLLTEEVMGLEGFSGNESILYHLTSPCRVTKVDEFEPIKRDEWVPDGHAHRHFATMGLDPEGDAITGRRLLMWNQDVEISLCRPDAEMDYFFRNGEGDEVIFVHEGTGTLETIFGEVPYGEGDYVVDPRGTTYRFRAEGDQRYLVFESPGLIEIPRRYRNEYGQLLEHAPFYHRDIHPPTELHTHRDRASSQVKVRIRDGYQTYVTRLPPLRRGRLGRLRLPVDVQHPRLRADHRPDPHAAPLAPDLRGPQLRDLLVLPAQARLRPGSDPDPVPPLEPELGGDDLLRLRELRLAAGDRSRLGDAAPVRNPARAASWPGGEVDRPDRDARARGDVRHLPPAAADEAREEARRRASTRTRGWKSARRLRETPTRIPPASRHTFRFQAQANGRGRTKAPQRNTPRRPRPAQRRSEGHRSSTTIMAVPPSLGLAVRLPPNDACTRQRPIAGGRKRMPVLPFPPSRSRKSR